MRIWIKLYIAYFIIWGPFMVYLFLIDYIQIEKFIIYTIFLLVPLKLVHNLHKQDKAIALKTAPEEYAETVLIVILNKSIYPGFELEEFENFLDDLLRKNGLGELDGDGFDLEKGNIEVFLAVKNAKEALSALSKPVSEKFPLLSGSEVTLFLSNDELENRVL